MLTILLVVLISLVLTEIGNYRFSVSRYQWLPRYFSKMKLLCGDLPYKNPYIIIALYILPLVLGVCLLLAISKHILPTEILHLILSVALVVYLMGPYSIKQRVHDIASEGKSAEAVLDSIDALQGHHAFDAGRELSQAIFVRRHETQFGNLFWYVLIGPFGLFCYWLVDMLKNSDEDSIDPALASIVVKIYSLLDWIPSRLTALGYALTGDFRHTFRSWCRYLTDWKVSSNEVLKECGEAALNMDRNLDGGESREVINDAIELVDRTGYFWLIIYVVVALSHMSG